jgi:O-methyltransferase
MITPLKTGLKYFVRTYIKPFLPSQLYSSLHSTYHFKSKLRKKKKEITLRDNFLTHPQIHIDLPARQEMLAQIDHINHHVDCPHTLDQILGYITHILCLPNESEGVIVEAGCFKGGSSSKFSLAACQMKRSLVIFDSFQGIPDNEEDHDVNIFGGAVGFAQGDYCGSLADVRDNITRYGVIESCEFIPGWFDDTLPQYQQEIDCIYLDVDLVSSTKTCLKYLYPLLRPGGSLFSQDGHLPLVIALLDDDQFWQDELECIKPQMIGLGSNKLVQVIKAS